MDADGAVRGSADLGGPGRASITYDGLTVARHDIYRCGVRRLGIFRIRLTMGFPDSQTLQIRGKQIF